MLHRPREDQLVAADRLRELGAPAEALIVEHFGAVLDALLWTVDFRHCCAGTPGSTHNVDCRHAELLHRLNPNFWSLHEQDKAWREAIDDDRFLEGARGIVIGDALNPATGNWYRLKRPGTTPAPPVAHARATGGEAVFALQMDRGVTSVVDDIHAVALQENERRERTIYARPAHRALSPEDIARAAQAVERSREQTIGNMRVYTNPNVAPGTVFVMQPNSFMNPLEVTRVDMPDHAPVAPPDDEDVP